MFIFVGLFVFEYELMFKMEIGYMDMKFGFVGSGGVSIDFGYIDMSLFILLVDKGKFIRDVLY